MVPHLPLGWRSTEYSYTLSDIDQKTAALRKNRYRSTVPAEFQKGR